MSDTVHREVSITVRELREAAVEMTEALSVSEYLARMPREHLPLVHAYMLGCVMRGAGIAPGSIAAVLQFVRLGYDDYAELG